MGPARLVRAKILLIGAGALGNEILKNLALLGVGRVFVADRDRIETSNLSRSVLFRQEDCGRPKSQVAAAAAAAIYPDMRIQPFYGNIVYELGLGVYRWADVILAALDNREARVAINRAAARAGKTWIDGAIERLDGVARVFDSACGPCYECTMNETDWKMLESRRSCALLPARSWPREKCRPRPPPPRSSPASNARRRSSCCTGWRRLSGEDSFSRASRTRATWSPTREKRIAPARSRRRAGITPRRVADTRIGDFLARVRADLGPEAVVEFSADLLGGLHCPKCKTEEEMLTSLGRVTEGQGRCPLCREHRLPKTFHTIDGREAFLDRTLGQIGVPPWDVLAGRRGMEQRFYEFAGDRPQVLGPLVE